MKRPIITLLTDFGHADYYVGAMKGVILGICPEAHLVDITHEIPPYQIRQAAWMLDQVWRCFPPGTVHLAVVDPGVGSDRKPILAEAAGHFWVAPDNGILTEVLAHVEAPAVRAISATNYFRHPVSQTFHGRDIFSPAAAHVASGLPTVELGKPTREFRRVELPKPVQTGLNTWSGEVLWVDRFGNVVTNLDAVNFGLLRDHPFELRLGRESVTRYEEYYAAMPAGAGFLTTGSAGLLEIAINNGNAAEVAGVRTGSTFTLRILSL